MKRGHISRPTEHAAIRAACRSARPHPPVPALMAALLDANARQDREGLCLAAHRIVRVADFEWEDQ